MVAFANMITQDRRPSVVTSVDPSSNVSIRSIVTAPRFSCIRLRRSRAHHARRFTTGIEAAAMNVRNFARSPALSVAMKSRITFAAASGNAFLPTRTTASGPPRQ